MQSVYFDQQCPECAKAMIDTGDEFVCSACGVVREKEIEESRHSRKIVAADFTRNALGSYLGSNASNGEERMPKRLSASGSTYAYLKTISDHAGREDDSVYECAKMIERVSEKLGLSKVVMAEAVTVAKKVLRIRGKVRRATLASVSAYSLMVACKIEGVGAVSTREILEAHVSMGRRVKVSSIIQLSLETGVRTDPKRAEDYLARVVARLSERGRFAKRTPEGRPVDEHYLHDLRGTAREMLSLVGEEAKAGRRPFALAATAVYAAEAVLASRESRGRLITQRDVAECSETAEYTVREQYRQVFFPSVMSQRAGRVPGPLDGVRLRTGPVAQRFLTATVES
jgi:transcription initiation factor TFIIIB Brf1 subunit/transcription initiation factor TFIIB